ncbi:MAG: hypothetical protein AAB606_02705 [Patescibacteria group bacterium]
MKTKTKILRNLLAFIPVVVTAAIFGGAASVLAAGIEVPSSLCGPFPCPEGDTGVEMAKSLAGRLVDNARYIIGATAVLLIVISGVKLVFARGNEEVLTKQTSAIIIGMIGLFIIGLAGEIANIFDVDRGGFLKDPNVMLQRAKLFSRTVEIVITFIKYIVGSFAVLFIIRNGIHLVVTGGSEEEISKDKKNILWGALGWL